MNAEAAEMIAEDCVLTFSPTVSEIAKALCLAQGNMGEIRKNAVNPHFNSSYANLAAIIDATSPALQAAGIAVVQGVGGDASSGMASVETLFLHGSGEWIRCKIKLKATKPDPQGIGSASTYGRRYQLSAMCNVTADDDDGNAASGKRGSDEPRAAQAAPAASRSVDRSQVAAETKARTAVVDITKARNVPTAWMTGAIARIAKTEGAKLSALSGEQMRELYRDILKAFPADKPAEPEAPVDEDYDTPSPEVIESTREMIGMSIAQYAAVLKRFGGALTPANARAVYDALGTFKRDASTG